MLIFAMTRPFRVEEEKHFPHSDSFRLLDAIKMVSLIGRFPLSMALLALRLKFPLRCFYQEDFDVYIRSCLSDVYSIRHSISFAYRYSLSLRHLMK